VNSSLEGHRVRERWIALLTRLAKPVLDAASAGALHQRMPVQCLRGNDADRRRFTHLEAVGRLLSGMAPWLETGDPAGAEGALRLRFSDAARAALDHATDPRSPGRLNFFEGRQPVVDSAFLSHALLRAPKALWEALEPRVRGRLLDCLRATRRCLPSFNNWLLFSALVEAALRRFEANDWDPVRIDYAIRQHEQWYVGDGHYADGPEFHWDYYNSFVIQPMLLDLLEVMRDCSEYEPLFELVRQRARRYAVVQERLIMPDGAFPPIGRSIAYRGGAFQHLAHMALRRELPNELAPAQVRGALTAVICRTLEAPGTFDAQGWLQIGLAGNQPSLGEDYISTGSLYLCSTAFLPLGLSVNEPFWAGVPQPWTSQRLWQGDDLPCDRALTRRRH